MYPHLVPQAYLVLPRHRHEEGVERAALVLRRATEAHVPRGAQRFEAHHSLVLACPHFDLLDAVVVRVGHIKYSGLFVIADSLKKKSAIEVEILVAPSTTNTNLWSLEPVENLAHNPRVDVDHNDAAVSRVRHKKGLLGRAHFPGVGEEAGFDLEAQLGRDGNWEPVAFGRGDGRLEVTKGKGDEFHEAGAVTLANEHPGNFRTSYHNYL